MESSERYRTEWSRGDNKHNNKNNICDDDNDALNWDAKG